MKDVVVCLPSHQRSASIPYHPTSSRVFNTESIKVQKLYLSLCNTFNTHVEPCRIFGQTVQIL